MFGLSKVHTFEPNISLIRLILIMQKHDWSYFVGWNLFLMFSIFKCNFLVLCVSIL